MNKTMSGVVVAALLAVVVGVGPAAQQQAADGANAVIPWAYTLNAPAPPGGGTAPDANEVLRVPGSSVTFMRSQMRDLFNPPDWHPGNHPPMPPIVSSGRAPDVRACGFCHLPNGQGRPENASIAGQPAEYIVQQMRDYRNGLRRSGEPRMGPSRLMVTIGMAATDAEAHAAAEYFSSFAFRPWIRVVETDMVPVTRVRGWMHVPVEGGGMEPIGTRIIETPEALERVELRDSEASFLAYVPTGAIARGEALVTTGGNGRTVACTVCHGASLRGVGPVPAIAGRSPSYVARQLYDLQIGARNGAWSDLMDAAVANLTVEDIVNIAAYTASLAP
jgi:cytochrome c553